MRRGRDGATLIDLYCRIFPDRYFQEMSKVVPQLENLGKRLRSVKKLFDLDLRFREMDEFCDYRQVISLPNPPLDNDLEICGPIKLVLHASSTRTDADFFIKLMDQFPLAYLFKKGHRIRLEIVNGDSPMTEALWTHYYWPDKIGQDTIYHSAQYPSALTLPISSG